MQLLNENYIDLVIVLILTYFATEVFRHGFWVILADFISFFGSLILSLRFYKYVAVFLKSSFSLNMSVSNAIGFLFAAIIFEFTLGLVLGYLVYKLPKKLKNHKINKQSFAGFVNKFLGVILGIGEGLVIVSFLLTLIVALPLKLQIKVAVVESKIGSFLVEKTFFIEKAANEVFGGVINDSLTYFTVNPDSNDTISLDVKILSLTVDEKAELEMFKKINIERQKLAIPELVLEYTITEVARNYAKDMWERKYFSHYSPEGANIVDRLGEANIKYSFAGENLALAPTIQTAHTGLMNSKGHRENILNTRFKKIGIGVIDNGVYGKMFVEVFTD